MPKPLCPDDSAGVSGGAVCYPLPAAAGAGS